MTARRRLVPVSEVKEMLDFLREQGFQFAAVDVRADGVTFLPANQNGGTDYEKWKTAPRKDQNRDRA